MQLSHGTNMLNLVMPVFLFLIVFSFLETMFDFLNNKISANMQRRLFDSIRVDQLHKKKQFTIPFIDSSDYEELKQRIDMVGNGIESQARLVSDIPRFVSIIINLAFSAYIAYSYNWFFASVIILIALPNFYFSFSKSFAQIKYWESRLSDVKYHWLFAGLLNGYQGLKDAKSSNNAVGLINRFYNWKKGYTDGQIKISNHYLNIAFIFSILMTLVIFGIQFAVIKDVVAGLMLVGSAILVVSQLSRLEGAINNLSYFLPSAYETVVTSKYLFLQAETKENLDKVTGAEFVRTNNKIEFKNIDFKYEDVKFHGLHKLNKEIDDVATKYFGLKKPEIEVKKKEPSNFNLKIDDLTINAGEKIAVVGKNGNGKTTFIQILLNIYQPQSGDIVLFGNNLKDLSQESITENFAVLYQDYSQPALKTHEFIALSERGEIDMEKVIRSAKIATADEFIEKWDDKYTQQIGVYMKGIKPSKGQFQKLALARTLYKDSPIIVLDEPTASVDALSGKKIFENIKNISSDKTVILVSHNMTDIASFADRILVFEDGRIVGDGPHEKLMKKCKAYKALYESETRV